MNGTLPGGVHQLSRGMLADRYGRRGVLVWDYVVFIGAAAVSALSPNVWWLLFARVVVGFGMGADFAISFAFLAEVCPPKTRGRTMAWIMCLANFGIVFAYGVGSLFLSFGGANGWRWTLGTGVFLAVPLILMRSAITESPLWQRDHHKSGTKWHEIIRDFKQSGVRRSLYISQGSYLLYQITDQGLGMFLPLILIWLLGVSAGTSAWSSVVVKAVTIPAALLTVWLIERWGRRPLQIYGFGGRAASLLILGGVFWSCATSPK